MWGRSLDKIILNDSGILEENGFSNRIEELCRDLKAFLTKLERYDHNNSLNSSDEISPDFKSDSTTQVSAVTAPNFSSLDHSSEQWEEKPLTQYLGEDLPVLTSSVDNLLDLVKQKDDELRSAWEMLGKSETLARVGMHMGGVVHELNNLIGSMMGYAQLAKLTGADEDINKCVDIALITTKRAQELLRQLRSVSRKQNTLDVINPVETIESVMHIVEPALTENDVRLEKNIEAVPWIIASGKSVRQSILILASTLIETLPKGGSLEFKCVQVGQDIVIEISENRNTPETVKQLDFDEIFSDNGKKSCVTPPLDFQKKSIVEQLIEESEGRLECVCIAGKGFSYQIIIPISP